MAKYLGVTNFEALQHSDIFKKSGGKPPWVKLFVKLLDNEDFDEFSYGAQLVYLKLLLLAARKENCVPNDANYISKRIGIDKKTVEKSLAELSKSRWIKAVGANQKLRIVRESFAPVLPLEENRLEEEEKEIVVSVRALADEWSSHPVLIAHREAYYHQPKAVTAVRVALRTYPVQDVREAIASYALVLASPDHLFTYKWAFADFLKRGLDRFVAEADPWENFRVKALPNGRGATVDSIFDQIGDEMAREKELTQ